MKIATVEHSPAGIAKAEVELEFLIDRQSKAQATYDETASALDWAIVAILENRSVGVDGLVYQGDSTLHRSSCGMVRDAYSWSVRDLRNVRDHVSRSFTSSNGFYKLHSCIVNKKESATLAPLAVNFRAAEEGLISNSEVEALRSGIARAQNVVEAPRKTRQALVSATNELVATIGPEAYSQADFDVLAAYVDAKRAVMALDN